MQQAVDAFLWYLLLAGLGWLAFPVAYRFLGALPDRGYAFARPLALLLWGFAFWVLSSYGLLQNDRGGLITALLLLAALSFWIWRQQPRGELGKWLRSKRSMIFAMELLFALAFIFMTLVRAARPDINHTEQPMELAFINAILRSPAMPPHDPWLSAFSISYYYFGFLMVAMLAKLIGITGSIAFNLGIVMVFAMAALGAYGLFYNLLALHKPQARKSLLWLAGLAPLFVLLLGNAEGLLEIMHSRHIFWRADAAGGQVSSVWTWLDIKDLVQPPTGEASWQPRLYGSGSWWWWRASRVINDKTFSGGEQELIDEFPAFSFVLGDLHPHVLSMPFVSLAIALALNLFLGGGERKEPLPFFELRVREEYLFFSALVLGGLGFLNIWDFPIYVGLFAAAYVLRQAQTIGWSWPRVREFFTLGILLGLGGWLAYLPFYLGFTSQAGGILPNLLNPTRGAQLWVMFAILLIPLTVYLLRTWREERRLARLLKAMLAAFAFVAVLWILSLGLAWLYGRLLSATGLGQAILAWLYGRLLSATGLGQVILAWLYGRLLAATGLGQAILANLGAPNLGGLFRESMVRRFAGPGAWITLIFLLGLLFGLVFKSLSPNERNRASKPEGKARSFVLLLMLVVALLITVPEFFYLRDQFSTRMNTVFKFYFQAWQMLAVAAAFAIVVLLNELRGLGRGLFLGLAALLIGIGLIYPIYAFSDVTRRPVGQALNLDGARYLSPDAIAAIQWLQRAPLAPLAEAVGGSYDASFARYSAHSGLPTVMGWPGHEGQWRGGNVDFGRITDIETLFSTQSWEVAQGILAKYGIRYVILGEVERSAYPVSEGKFQEHLLTVFQSGQVTIYQVP